MKTDITFSGLNCPKKEGFLILQDMKSIQIDIPWPIFFAV